MRLPTNIAEKYLEEHNRRFAGKAGEPEDLSPAASRPALELCHTFRLEPEREIDNDWRSVKAVICNCGLGRNAVDRRKAKLWYAKGKESA
jgi:hypothetical protein